MEEGADHTGPQALSRAPPGHSHSDALVDNVLEEVLEYAYEHDLIRDHLLDSFSLSHLFGDLIQSTIPATTENGFTDCIHLTALELPNPTPRTEKPTVSDSALRIICETRRELSDEEVEGLTQKVCNDGNVRDLKLELPILRTDNDRDLRVFQREVLARQDAHKGDHRIPFEPIDVKAGEGLELPDKARLETEAFLIKLEGEKLGVTTESTRYLVGSLRAELTEEDQRNFIKAHVKDIRCQKNPALDKLELPISPQLGPQYSVPLSDSRLVPIPSDQSSSMFNDDLEVTEKYLFEDMDRLETPTSPILEMFLEDYPSCMEIEPARERLSSHKIEMPLLPGLSPAKPAQSGVQAFSEIVTEDVDFEKQVEDTVFIKDFPEDNLVSQFDVAADRAMKSIEQEQLQATDAIARVPMPVMDFSIIEPEWTRLRNSAPAIFKWVQGGHEEIFNLPKWPGDMLVESKLIWRPIGPGACSVSMAEKIEASEDLIHSFIGPEDEKNIFSSSDFVQRRDKLVVLGKWDEDEAIEPLLTSTKPRTDLVEMVKKRGLDAIDTTSKRQRLAENKPFVNQASGGKPSEGVLKGLNQDMKSRDKQTLLQQSSFRGPGRFLDQYTKLCAPQKSTASKYFPAKEVKPDEMPALPSPPESSERNRRDKSQDLLEPEATAQPKPECTAPYPPISPPSKSLTVFISLSINRHLVSALNRLIPSLGLIERDYRAYNTSVWSPGSVSRAEVVPSLAYDADITVSPTTGLVITSMILIRQKPRLGLSKNSFQERIEKVSARYERVIVLIGGVGGDSDTLREITTSDSTALTELQGFTSGIECRVMVYYIGGGDETLSKWVASMVCRYAQTDHPQEQNGLLEAETLWELFLRRAGFNVYAAQVVAGQLKVPIAGEETTGMSRHGLAAFVTMTRAERKESFGKLVGLRVLERVGRIVDEVWNKG